MIPPIILILLLGVLFSAVLQHPYLFSDDYFMLNKALSGDSPFFFESGIAAGRPITGFVWFHAFNGIQDIAHASYLRAVSVGGIVLLSILTYRKLLGNSWGRLQALSISLAMASMPAFLVYAYWAVAFPYPLASVMAVLAQSLVEKAGEATGLRRVGMGVGGIFLLFLGFLIYQPAALFFWVFVVIRTFSHQVLEGRPFRFFATMVGMFGIGAVLAFGAQRFGAHMFPHGIGGSRSSLSFDPLGKVQWFAQNVLVDALNFNSLAPTTAVALVIGTLILFGLWLHLRHFGARSVLLLGIAFAVLPLSVLGNLVSAESWTSYRIQLTLTSVLVFYGALALRGWSQLSASPYVRRLLSPALALLAGYLFVVSHANLRQAFVLPQVTELHHFRSQLAQADLSRVKTIVIRPSANWDALTPQIRYDEVGIPSFKVEWVPVPAVSLLLREMKRSPADYHIQVERSEGPASSEPTQLILDARSIPRL